jgi:integrase/recombinase XerD
LFDLATGLMQRAEAETSRPARRRALWFRDGLLIAVLCAWVPRARNVAETVIGVSLQRRGAAWWAAFGSDGTKNKRPIEVPPPDEYTAWIERYLDHYRPELVSRSATPAAGDAFWISDGDDPAHVGIAQPLLGHADYRTTQQAYNLGRALDAARQHHRLVRSIRSKAPPNTPQIRQGVQPPGTIPASRPVLRKGAR